AAFIAMKHFFMHTARVSASFRQGMTTDTSTAVSAASWVGSSRVAAIALIRYGEQQILCSSFSGFREAIAPGKAWWGREVRINGNYLPNGCLSAHGGRRVS